MLDFERDGAQHFPGAAKGRVQGLRAAFEHLPLERAGVRLAALPIASGLFSAHGAVGAVAASVLGAEARPVRAIYFDKSEQTNWSLDWHQDRVICVQEKVESPGFGAWTIKSGLLHVAPPFSVLEKMVTIRVHLDGVGKDNAPLLIAPGSHRLGKIEEERLQSVVEQCGEVACLADAGDVWLYSTPIVHASKASTIRSRRRILQIDYAAFDLPAGLKWRGLSFFDERVADGTN